jgi:hypothetical protein
MSMTAFRRASAGLLVLLAGCSTARLVPVAPISGAEALAIGSGVEVRADSSVLERPWTVPETYTPLRLLVRNIGNAPVYVALDDIRLTGQGRAQSAVPPLDILPREQVGSLGVDPGSPFVFLQRTSAGPRLGHSESVIVEPPVSTLPAWSRARERGRAEILRSAFSEGLIAQGETRAGWVYFRAVPSDAGRLTLRIPVRPTKEGAPVSIVEIVYAVRS